VALLALLGYAVLAILLYGRAALADPTHVVVGSGQTPQLAGRDQGSYVWFLAWAKHALIHLQNPFHTTALYAPWGYNLAWAASMLGPAALMLPVTTTAGPVAAYDVLACAAPATAAWTAFLLCRQLSGRTEPSLAGGALFGFSSYVTGETINHVNLALVALLPLAALLVVRRVEGLDSRRRFVIGLTLVLALQLWTATEVFASLVVLGAAGMAVAWALAGARLRPSVPAAAGEATLAVAGAVILGAPYVYYAVARSDPFGRVTQVVNGADLANLVVPSPATWLHVGPRLGLSWNVSEQLAYLGVPLIVLLGAFLLTHRRERSGRMLAALLVVALLASLGGQLRIAGHATRVMLPWNLVHGLPLLRHAIPGRFVVYVWLIAAVACALWLAQAPRGRWRWALAVLALVALVPNQTGRRWGTRLDAPPLLAVGGGYGRYIPRGATVLALPFGIDGNSMIWQVQADFGFRLAGGYPSFTLPAEYARFPIIPALGGAPAQKDTTRQLREFLRATGVGVVLLRQGTPGDWNQLLAGLHVRPIARGGFEIYRLGAGTTVAASISASERRPAIAIVRSRSARSARTTWTTPSSPAIPRPQTHGRATSTARAPSASAVITSEPVRMPLSKSTGKSSGTTSTTPGSASSAAIDPSTCRPPWFETTIPSYPRRTASRASSGCSTPLTRSGRSVASRR